jgi:hypothetical protein
MSRGIWICSSNSLAPLKLETDQCLPRLMEVRSLFLSCSLWPCPQMHYKVLCNRPIKALRTMVNPTWILNMPWVSLARRNLLPCIKLVIYRWVCHRFRSCACIHLTIPFSGASFNNFLDAIDASYCTFDGGDDPAVDGSYPNPTGYSKCINIAPLGRSHNGCRIFRPQGLRQIQARQGYLNLLWVQ